VVVLYGHAEACAHRGELEQVADTASDNNIFYEPWMLLAAMDAFAPADAIIVLVRDANGAARGYFPLSRERLAGGFNATRLTSWRHPYCFLCTPLIAEGHAHEVVAALLDWLEDGASPASCLDLRDVAADSIFAFALASALEQRRTLVHDRDGFERALFVPSHHDRRMPLSSRRSKDLRRLERRLAARGRIEFTQLQPGEDAMPWIERFLALEYSGWKGRAGSALAVMPRAREFFVAIASQAHRCARLDMRALELDGIPIAMQCNFVAGSGAYAFKVAYDERHAGASPGLQLELHAMRQLPESNPDMHWMDSCARPDHAMMNRLWPQRRSISRFIIAPSGSPAVAQLLARRASRLAMRILKTLRQGLRRKRQGASENLR
jgi:CelD/BcsL family acetyltransferase involved in cellulose biosynthesis